MAPEPTPANQHTPAHRDYVPMGQRSHFPSGKCDPEVSKKIFPGETI